MADERPNIVVLMVDQWRGDCLGIAGHPVVRTPYLDDLSARGARFDRAYSATPTCIPARASLHTGLGQRSHRRVGYEASRPWAYPVTLAGELSRGGYQTEAIGKMHVNPFRSRQGFQHVQLHDGHIRYGRVKHPDGEPADDYLHWVREQTDVTRDYFEHGLDSNSYVARPWDKDEHLHPTNWVFGQGIDFLRRRDPESPFMLFLSFRAPHPPYDPPTWAFESYLGREMPQPPVGDWAGIFDRYRERRYPDVYYGSRRADPFVADLPPDVLQRTRAGYYGLMTHIDTLLNRFMEELEIRGFAENTYILFLSDHGELLGDHHLFRKGHHYEGSARVPFFLVGPQGGGIEPGLVDAEHVVELRDVMPTLLDCAGLPIPESVEGHSVLPLARGERADWREYLHGEHAIFGQSIQWVTDGHEKYAWFSEDGHEQLFRLGDDPEELHDLAQRPEEAERVSHWRERLVRELTGREEGYVEDGRLVPGRPPQLWLTSP